MATGPRFLCPACGAKLKSAKLPRRRVTCPQCGHAFEPGAVPAEAEPATTGNSVQNPGRSEAKPSNDRRVPSIPLAPTQPRRAWFFVGGAGALVAALSLIAIVLFRPGHLTKPPAQHDISGDDAEQTDQHPSSDQSKTDIPLADQRRGSKPSWLGVRRTDQSLASTSRPKAALQAQEQGVGRKLAFLVGVKGYRHAGLSNLDFPENDVNELADILKPLGFHVVLLTTASGRINPDLNPTSANIRAQLEKLLGEPSVGKRDLIVVGLAGHGLQPDKEAYFCPTDANPTRTDTLIALDDLLKVLDDSGIGEKLVLVDACRNDPKIRGRRGIERVDVSALPAQTGVLLSCAQGEFAYEHKTLGTGHGVFFYHVIEGLKGEARDSDGEVTWDSLRAYVKKRVPQTVIRLYGRDGGQQRPNDIGNLIGESPELVAARIGTKSEPKPDEPTLETPNTFYGTHAGQLRDDNGLKTKLVWIPPGEFTMGSPDGETDRLNNENSVQVTLRKGFWLGQHEVTQGEWYRVMQTRPWSGKAHVKEGDDYPATYVSWDDNVKFCEKLTEQERTAGRLPLGWQYTLPTEAQWEYACRAGTTTRFSFGNDESDLSDYAWCAGIFEEGNAKSEPYSQLVGQKKANRWGLRDMHGNVWEWCLDRYAKELVGGTDPRGPSEGSTRALRGGSYDSTARFCRSAYRTWNAPDFLNSDQGFRVTAVPSDK